MNARDLDPDLLEKLAGRAPRGVDVYAIAAEVQEMTERRRHQARPVKNPNGLLVSWYRKACNELHTQQRQTREQLSRESARYGELYVQLFALLALEAPKPCDLAQTLETLRASGYSRLNPDLIARLRALGADWHAAVGDAAGVAGQSTGTGG